MRARLLILLLALVALLAPGQALASPNAGVNGGIVFSRDIGGGVHHIFSANVDGTNVVDLSGAASPYDDVDPAVSPDGTRIAFARGNGGPHDIYVMNSDGTGTPIRLTSAFADEREPTWSPDGNTIAYAYQTAVPSTGWDIWEVNAGGTNPGSIGASQPGDDRRPSFSPDGLWLLWSNISKIWEATPSGGAPSNVIISATADTAPVWSPDSDRWAWVCSGQICVTTPDGLSWSAIAGSGGAVGGISWSPDGTRILFTNGTGVASILYGGGGLLQLTATPGDFAGDWLPGALVNTRIPQASGAFKLGATVVADAGVWRGSGISYAYQWMRCNPPGGNGCVPIAGATSAAYTTVVTDLNAALRVYVTATNAAGSATAASVPYGPVTNPITSLLPVVTFTDLSIGSTLTATTGSVGSGLGSAPLSFSFQWQRCDTTGNACTTVAGATAPTYVLSSADAGHTIRVVVTATNTNGSALGTSLETAVVGGLAPSNTTIPAIAGTPVIGQTLTSSTGVWTGAGGLSYTFQWLRCDAGGANCQPIAGATTSSYAIVVADAGQTLVVAVTATNSHGSVESDSVSTTIVGASPADFGPGMPAGTIAPNVLGTPAVGSKLTATSGGFVGTDLTYGYGWQRCDTTATICSTVSGATSSSYLLTKSDAGSTFRVVVTASNSIGSASGASDITSVIVVPPATATGSTQSLKTKRKVVAKKPALKKKAAVKHPAVKKR